VTNRIPNEKKKEVVYGIPCCDHDQVYVGTCRSTSQSTSELLDDKNGIAVYVLQNDHGIDWENVRVTPTHAQTAETRPFFLLLFRLGNEASMQFSSNY